MPRRKSQKKENIHRKKAAAATESETLWNETRKLYREARARDVLPLWQHRPSETRQKIPNFIHCGVRIAYTSSTHNTSPLALAGRIETIMLPQDIERERRKKKQHNTKTKTYIYTWCAYTKSRVQSMNNKLRGSEQYNSVRQLLSITFAILQCVPSRRHPRPRHSQYNALNFIYSGFSG